MNLKQSNKALLAASLLGFAGGDTTRQLVREIPTKPNDPEILKAAELKRLRKQKRNLENARPLLKK